MRQAVINADASAVLAVTDAVRFPVMITDPPYSPHVHASAVSQSKRKGVRHRDFSFDSLSPATRSFVGRVAANVKRWSVIYSDVESSTWMRIACQAAGATYVRKIPWIRWSMPQLSGDRPPQGFEHLLLFWGRQKGKKSWNGSGALTHLSHACLRGDKKHSAEKGLDQCLDLVSWFSDPKEDVLDLFAGSAAIGQACRLLDRGYIGYEVDPRWAERGNRRLRTPLSPRDQDRVERWLAADDVQVSEEMTPPALRRSQRREEDKRAVAAKVLSLSTQGRVFFLPRVPNASM